MSGAERVVDPAGPLIVYANHSSWWDPMVAVIVAERLLPGRTHYAPMDAEALGRYGILRRIGIFPVEMGSPRGAARFLRTGKAVLDGGGVLWVTPQGRFVDARVRPLEFKPGLATLAVRAATAERPCTVLPMAIEYTFWDERLPECLLRFGEAVVVTAGETADEVDERLRAALLTEMDALRELAVGRDPGCFVTLAEGGSGTGGWYSIGQRIKAFVLRREYRADHTYRPGVGAVATVAKNGDER